MKIVYNRFIPFKGFKALNLFGVIFVRKDVNMLPRDWNHEKIYTAQQKELLYVGFYLIYLCEWLWNLFENAWTGGDAYHEISFEEEAYAHQYDFDYLKTRKRFAMWRKKK